MQNKKVIFFGTPWIAKECLKTIHEINGIDVIAIVTQPDREFDRKKNPIYSDVKKFAIENKIKYFQPEKLLEIYQDLLTLNPDIFITCAYGQFIPQKILDIPKYKCVNIHASLLPKLRGGAPIHWSIINGDKQTGITFMYTIKEMDAGNIIFKQAINIDNHDTYKTLLIKLCDLAKSMIKEKILDLFCENINSIEQDKDAVSFGYNIKKEDEIINWNKNAKNIYDLIRGLNDKPVAKWIYKNTVIKVFESTISNNKSTKEPGTITNITKRGIEIATLDFDIVITRIQLPSKNVSDVKDLINGKSLDFLKNN